MKRDIKVITAALGEANILLTFVFFSLMLLNLFQIKYFPYSYIVDITDLSANTQSNLNFTVKISPYVLALIAITYHIFKIICLFGKYSLSELIKDDLEMRARLAKWSKYLAITALCSITINLGAWLIARLVLQLPEDIDVLVAMILYAPLLILTSIPSIIAIISVCGWALINIYSLIISRCPAPQINEEGKIHYSATHYIKYPLYLIALIIQIYAFLQLELLY